MHVGGWEWGCYSRNPPPSRTKAVPCLDTQDTKKDKTDSRSPRPSKPLAKLGATVPGCRPVVATWKLGAQAKFMLLKQQFPEDGTAQNQFYPSTAMSESTV